MQIGINWTYPPSLSIIQKLIEFRYIDFCEISLDNFIHLDPEQVQDALGSIPLSFHILSSRFLEKTLPELQEMAAVIRQWIHVLKPLYVSDHLAQFTEGNRRLPLVTEIDYCKNRQLAERVTLWQELLEQRLLLENFPSFCSMETMQQPQFFCELMQKTGCGLLFDFSNAYIAELNQVCQFSAWQTLIERSQHFHVAGFQMAGNPPLAMDTHAVGVADEVLKCMENSLVNTTQKTLVIERDIKSDFAAWEAEILTVKQLFHREKNDY